MLTLRELDVYLLADLLGVGGRDDPGLATGAARRLTRVRQRRGRVARRQRRRRLLG